MRILIIRYPYPMMASGRSHWRTVLRLYGCEFRPDNINKIGKRSKGRTANLVLIAVPADRLMKWIYLIIAVFLSAAEGRAEGGGLVDEVSCPHCAAMEFDRLAAMLTDDALRDMVCRLSSQRFTPARLGGALGLSEGQVLPRINRLRAWGLVRLARTDSAHAFVEPIPGDGARTLARWAVRYCPAGDGCGGPVGYAPLPEHRKGAKSPGFGASADAFSILGLKDKLVTVFGGSGFIGRHVVDGLLRAGARVRVGVRHPELAPALKSLADEGKIQFMTVDIGDEALVKKAVSGAHMVINLVGMLNQNGSQRFYTVHVEGAHVVAEAASAADTERLVHVSALGADTRAATAYARTKALGERFMRALYPTVTVVRPNVVFGPGDRFISQIASLSRYSPIMPLYGSDQVHIQPVYVGDVSEAVVRILADPATIGQTYDLSGPRSMTTREIFDLVLEHTRRRRLLLPLPRWFARLNGDFLQGVPTAHETRDDVSPAHDGDSAELKTLGLADLGITPTPFEDVLPGYLGKTRDAAGSKAAY